MGLRLCTLAQQGSLDGTLRMGGLPAGPIDRLVTGPMQSARPRSPNMRGTCKHCQPLALQRTSPYYRVEIRPPLLVWLPTRRGLQCGLGRRAPRRAVHAADPLYAAVPPWHERCQQPRDIEASHQGSAPQRSTNHLAPTGTKPLTGHPKGAVLRTPI